MRRPSPKRRWTRPKSGPRHHRRSDRALTQAQGTLANYDGNSTFSREMEAALRDIQRAAQSVDSLSRALERRPNSIILGR